MSRSSKWEHTLLGRRQTASQEILDLPFGGSNPPAPAMILIWVIEDMKPDVQDCRRFNEG